MTKKYLSEVYKLKSLDQTKDFYKKWATTYDSELFANGYITPKRCAVALEAMAIDKRDYIIDIGCGTGLSGAAFKEVGFSNIDGSDFSSEMLTLAREKNIYKNLTISSNKNPFNFEREKYSHVAAVGVFSPLHALPEMIEEMLKVAKVGCFFVFSLNDHALANPKYEEMVKYLEHTGVAEVSYRKYGHHLPKIKLNSLIYVLKRLK